MHRWRPGYRFGHRTGTCSRVEPSGSSQAIGDALVGSAELPFRAILPLVQGSSLESPANTAAALSLMPVAVIASLFSKQCHLGDTRGCFAQAQR